MDKALIGWCQACNAECFVGYGECTACGSPIVCSGAIVPELKQRGPWAKAMEPTPISPDFRERLGRRVRQVWMEWACQQPDCKPDWIDPWEALPERIKEVDMRIGAAIWGDAVAEFSEQLANAAMKSLEKKP